MQTITTKTKCEMAVKELNLPQNHGSSAMERQQGTWPAGCIYASNTFLALNAADTYIGSNPQCGSTSDDTYDCICERTGKFKLLIKNKFYFRFFEVSNY